MDNAKAWRDFFHHWPKDLPTRGLLVTSFDEQILFASFMMTESLLLVERQTPDAQGGRQVFLPYGNILAVKVVDPVQTSVFVGAGFQAPAAPS